MNNTEAASPIRLAGTIASGATFWAISQVATPPMADATTSASFTVRDSGTSVSHWVRVTAVPEGARVRLRVTVQTQGGTSVNEEYTVPAGR